MAQNFNPSTSFENVVKSLAIEIMQFQQEMKARIQSLVSQARQMILTIHHLVQQSSAQVPSHTIVLAFGRTLVINSRWEKSCRLLEDFINKIVTFLNLFFYPIFIMSFICKVVIVIAYLSMGN